jgi:hypothetical protein
MPYTFTGKAALGPITLARATAAAALELWDHLRAGGLPVTAADSKGENITYSEMVALAEGEDLERADRPTV